MTERETPASRLLTEEEAALLRRALLEWGGPARCSDLLAAAMGFADAQDLLDQCRRIRRALAEDTPLSRADWARTLLSAEIVFVSDLAGSGTDWPTTTGFSDESTIRSLRSIQRKLARTVSPYYGRTPGSPPVPPEADHGASGTPAIG